MARVNVRKGMPSVALTKAAFARRLRRHFYDPAFKPVEREIERIVDVARGGCNESRKSPRTRPAGARHADPSYQLSVEWPEASRAVGRAERQQKSRSAKSRILLIRSFRPVPCSCCPDHSLGQHTDRMNEIYPMWSAAHGVMIVTSVDWYQVPTGLKAMMEMKGWPYPRHLTGRAFSVVVHGDAAGAENLRRMLVDRLKDTGLLSAGPAAERDRGVGYHEPYATSHDALDRDRPSRRRRATPHAPSSRP